ncbi:PREDICTED: uncharacterized protein LOC109344101 isoform X2 [Lupinus angustifolius]|uniref:uncharacterized protein LOC109344101 isoform X2 n=1 Tax=Lupinus angustifolius TaxID=3871 RepID=UPI00092E6EF6|nr:PREDICTED: uncharacterized protein LOC109344101 isoform X2 [Lupinus angustifolius]
MDRNMNMNMNSNMNMDMDLGFDFGGGVDNNDWNLSNIVNNMQTLPYNNTNTNTNNPYTGSQEQAPLSMPEHNHFSVPNVNEPQYDPGYMQFDGNANRSEPYSHLQQPFVPMTPNPFVPQYGYMPMQPEPTAPSMYSLPYDSQTMVPSGDRQQGVSSMQFQGSTGQLDQMIGYNHLLNTPDFQYQSSILHEPSTMSCNFTSSQAPRTWNQGLSGTWTNEGFPSRVSSSMFPEVTRPLRLERPSTVQMEQVTSASANELIATQRGKGKLPESSTTRAKLSPEIQRILNMKPKGRLSLYDTTSTATPQRSQNLNLQNGRDSSMDNVGKQLAKKKEPVHATPRMSTVGEGDYEPRRRGRPRKACQDKQVPKIGKLHGERGNVGSSQEANNTLRNEEENANHTNLISSLRIPNALYDPKFEKEGLPVDPFLRLFKEFGK